MKYLVTGGAGFIGSHLVKQLRADGHTVIVPESILDCVSYFVDGVFHLAAMVGIPRCIKDPVSAGMVNVQGTLNVLEMARLAKVKRVVLASSNIVYANHTPYQTTKEMLELWTRCYVETYGLSALALRFGNVYGPGQTFGVFPAWRKSLQEHGHITVSGDGEQSRDYVHVSDIVRGLIAAMKSDYVGEAIDLCTGRNWTINQLWRLWGFPPIRHVPASYRDSKHLIQSPTRARDILNWKAEIQLEQGIHELIHHPENTAAHC